MADGLVPRRLETAAEARPKLGFHSGNGSTLSPFSAVLKPQVAHAGRQTSGRGSRVGEPVDASSADLVLAPRFL
jgi:hypothetical protein